MVIAAASIGIARADRYRGDGFELALVRGAQRERLGETVRTFETPDGREALGVAATTIAPETRFDTLVRDVGQRWAPALGPLTSCGTTRVDGRAIACLESGLGFTHQIVRLGVVLAPGGRVVLVVYRDRRPPPSVRSAESFLAILSSVKPTALRSRELRPELTPPLATEAAREQLTRLAAAKGAVSVRLLLYPTAGGREVAGDPKAVRLDVRPFALVELPADVHVRIGGVASALTMLELMTFGGATIDYNVENGFFVRPARR